jgi:dephospho-CoA kinase
VHVFGLTGGIASGKSAVAARWRARGVPIVDADVIAREVVQKGSPALAEIVRELGEGVLDAGGELDRKKVAAIVFGDDDKRRRLNAITHPRIGALSMQRAAEHGARGEPLVCYEAALLVENGLADATRPLVVVSAPEDVQAARAAARDGVSVEHARARIAAQMPLAAKVAVADVIVDNRGSLADLQREADRALADVCARVGVDVARYPAITPAPAGAADERGASP